MQIGGMIIILVLGLISGALFTAQLIPLLQHKQMGQNIRTEGPSSHHAKAGTPTMGGIAIIMATVLSAFVAGHITKDTWVILGGFTAFGLIGFFDDYLKAIKKQNEGLLAWQKFSLQTLLSLAVGIYIVYFSGHELSLYIPFVKENFSLAQWPIVFLIFIVFTIIAMSNGVNLTDGLDGLASGITAVVSVFMAFTVMNLPKLMPASAVKTLEMTPAAGFFAALAGASIGFLIFNKNPAKVFMGDTGSLAIGGGLAVAACMTNLEIFLPIVGIIYVLEVVSVILQVVVFKTTGGKRLFKMAPLHHHFEESGMKETAVVAMFWGITIAVTAITFFLG